VLAVDDCDVSTLVTAANPFADNGGGLECRTTRRGNLFLNAQRSTLNPFDGVRWPSSSCPRTLYSDGFAGVRIWISCTTVNPLVFGFVHTNCGSSTGRMKCWARYRVALLAPQVECIGQYVPDMYCLVI